MRASRLALGYPEHAGLALYRYLKAHDKDGTETRNLLEAIAKTPISPAYSAAFGRWKGALDSAVFIEATTTSPLAIGLGNSSPIENGLSIHHTYGTPYLPGSAIKGLLTRAADQHKLSDEQKKVLFGDTDRAAHIVYWDGWLDPASSQPFQKDVITVHHQDYYSSKGKNWPTDFDDPNPVAFLSVKPGTKFVLALSSFSVNSTDWLFVAAKLLQFGLENLGLGGKTNAGYGYFKVEPPKKPKSEAEQGQELYQSYKSRIEKIKPNNERGELEFFLRELSGKSALVRKPSLEAIKKQLEEWKSWKLSNPQHASVQALLEES